MRSEEGNWIFTSGESSAVAGSRKIQGGHYPRVVKLTVKIAPPVMIEAETDAHDNAGERPRNWKLALSNP
jgi:hypothetical protein